MSPTIIGIDPGITGAIAAIDRHGDPVDLGVWDMPAVDGWVSPTLLADLRWSLPSADLVVVERVRSMPRQGVASVFKFGASWGTALGVFAGMPTEQPTPAAWKKAMGLGRDKEQCRALALDLWPSLADSLARKKDHGRAEALLLAEWGRRLLVERGQA